MGEETWQINMSLIYVIDSSTIIDLFRWSPPVMEIFKPICNRIEQISNGGVLVSHYEVHREIERKSDMANELCKNHRDIFFDLDE
ncbi:MAG: PIN domain-containing protein, partial [Methanoculleaceae archaeon]